MAHNVICPVCGKTFDADYGASYNKRSRRYTCPSCAAKQAEGAVKKKAVLPKILMGLFFVCAAVFFWISLDFGGDWSIGYFIVSLLFGFAFLGAGILCFKKAYGRYPWTKKQ